MSRYLKNKNHFLKYAYIALRVYFTDKHDFDAFFNSIPTNESKEMFLKTSSTYLFLVKKGNFEFSDEILKGAQTYINDTYKYIGIFSLIESLYVGDKFVEFYDYLMDKKNKAYYPISSTDDLRKVFDNYKKDYGAVKNAVKFFNGLDKRDRYRIISKFEVENRKSSVTDLAKLLYQIRSDFIHNAKLVLGFGDDISIGRIGKKVVANRLHIRDLMIIFEHGLLRHFGFKGQFYN